MNYPIPKISKLKKILNYLQYMQVLKDKIKTIRVFGRYLMQKESYAEEKAFFMKC